MLITPDFRVKLIDFGLSEIAAPGQALNTICGTPLYCSPEVLFLHSTSRRKGFFGGPADVWSVGVLMFALLTGCAPFDDSNFTRLREEIYRNSIAYPRFMSDEVKGLLKSLLVFDAHLRPTVKDILAYGWFQQHDESSARAPALALAPSVVVSAPELNPQSSSEPTASPTAKDESPERESESPRKSSSSSSSLRHRSISSRSDNGTEGTSSSSGSFEDAVSEKLAPRDNQTHQATTHLPCLEAA